MGKNSGSQSRILTLSCSPARQGLPEDRRLRPGTAVVLVAVVVVAIFIRLLYPAVARTRPEQQSYLLTACKCYDDVHGTAQSRGLGWHRATGVRTQSR